MTSLVHLIAFLSISSAPVFTHSGVEKMITSTHQVRTPKIVYVHGGISQATAKTFAASMIAAKNTGQPVIPVVISSYGGSVYALLEMIDVIKTIDVPVATIIVGKAMSAGGVLASCGSPGMRYMAPTATFMIHEVSTGSMGKINDVKASADEAVRLNKLIFEIMADNLGKPKDFFIQMIHKNDHADIYLTAKEAMKLGLVNHIGIPNIKIDVRVEMDLR